MSRICVLTTAVLMHASAVAADPFQDHVEKVAHAALDCTSAALRRYALTSPDPAPAIAKAAYDACGRDWGEYIKIMRWGFEHNPEFMAQHPTDLPVAAFVKASQEIERTALQIFTPEVFEIRAAGK